MNDVNAPLLTCVTNKRCIWL